ncbi:GNAT family N-acetyltransferase [Myxococcota bacterium]|nr:GNAT family N-acetyltransferase [Myxococcota bacterium]
MTGAPVSIGQESGSLRGLTTSTHPAGALQGDQGIWCTLAGSALGLLRPLGWGAGMHRGPWNLVVGWPENFGPGRRPGDLEQLCALLESIQPGAWSMDRLEKEKTRPDGLAVWARRGAATVAALLGRVVVDELHILELVTAVADRRQGLAKGLLARAVELAGRQGCSRVLLELRASNQAARRLYESVGFVVVGARSRYYRDGEDALLMTCAFDDVEGGAPDGETTL